jgi:dTDP-4-amino-4,6-dideoxygalactose transaminase
MIPLVDPRAEYESLKSELDKVILGVAGSGQYVLGANVEAFEKEFAAYIGVEHAIGTGSGTDALRIALLSLGVKTGDEVITSPFSFVATADSIAQIGAIPVFVDIDPETFNIDAHKIEHKISSKTKALLPVHLFGQPCEMDMIGDLADEYGLKVLEDCAQAAGAGFGAKKTGSIGHAGAFSFFPTKNLGCMGDGGMITTNDDETANMARMLRVHGAASKYDHEMLGYNSRLDEVQAAVLRVKLKMLDGWINLRIQAAKLYDEHITAEHVTKPAVDNGSKHAFNIYTITTGKRDRLAAHLKKNDISSSVNYPTPLHLQKAFSYLGYEKNSLREAEQASSEVLSLPMHPHLSTQQVQTVADCVNSFDPYNG